MRKGGGRVFRTTTQRSITGSYCLIIYELDGYWREDYRRFRAEVLSRITLVLEKDNISLYTHCMHNSEVIIDKNRLVIYSDGILFTK